MMNFLLSLPDLVLVILGFIFLIFGGESVVQGAITIARKMNVSPLLIGFTIVAVGTSLPELAVTINAVSSNSQELVDLAVGGVLGSNVANIMLVLGTAAMLGACDKPGVEIKKDMKIQASPLPKYENRKKDYYRYNLLYNRLASFANDTQLSPLS